MELLQQYILSQYLIIGALLIVFAIISRWALIVLREYPGYGLGWMMGLFFIIVRVSVGGADLPEGSNEFLNGGQVFLATFMGLIVGSIILVGLRFGMRHARSISLQVAIYTALNIILIFLVGISNPVFQKMVGIFSLAIGIATLFAMVLFPSPQREQELNIRAQGATQSQPINSPNYGQGGGSSRLDEIRRSQKERLGR